MNRSGTLKSDDLKSLRWTCPVSLVLILSTTGIAFGETLSTDPVDFVSVLLRQNAYLFEESTRVQLDSLNRDLREAAKLLKEGATGEEGDEAAATIRRAEQRLRTLLQDAPSTIPLDFRAGVPGTFADAPVPLPGSVGGLLFRITRGEEETGYFTLDYTMAVTERSGPIRIEVAPSGTTFALVNLTEVPVGRTSLLFEFRGEGVDPVRWPLDIRTPQRARLKVNVLSADTGKPTAAMVRLTWKTNGLDYKPSNAVDLTSQFDGQGIPLAGVRHSCRGGFAVSIGVCPDPSIWLSRRVSGRSLYVADWSTFQSSTISRWRRGRLSNVHTNPDAGLICRNLDGFRATTTFTPEYSVTTTRNDL